MELTVSQMQEIFLLSGADKVGVNTGAVKNPELLTEPDDYIWKTMCCNHGY